VTIIRDSAETSSDIRNEGNSSAEVYSKRLWTASIYIFLISNITYNNSYSSPNIIRMVKSRRMRYAGHVARMGEKTNTYRMLVGKPGGKRPLGRLRRRWVDNIEIELRKIGCDGMDLIDLAQDRDQWRALVNTVMNLGVP
jgi:hypothetical protein